jgi:hypothetical protein
MSFLTEIDIGLSPTSLEQKQELPLSKKHYHIMNTTTLTAAHNQLLNRPADERFANIQELHSYLVLRDKHDRRVDAPISQLEFQPSPAGAIPTIENRAQGQFTNWSFNGMCQALRAPAGFLATLPPELQADILNYRTGQTRRLTSGYRRMLTLNDMTGDPVVRAVTSPTYGHIPDSQVVESTMRMLEARGNRFYNPKAYAVTYDENGKPNGIDSSRQEPAGIYAGDRDFFLFMIDGGSLLDIGPRAKLNRGFIIRGSEVGSSSQILTTFYFNVVCGNHLIWGAQNVCNHRIVHRANAPGRMKGQFIPMLNALGALAEGTAQEIDPIRRAMERPYLDLIPKREREKVTLGDLSDTKALSDRWGFTQEEVAKAKATALREEGKLETVWDLVQGFTASARLIPHADRRFALERAAGRLIELPA